MGIKQEEPQEQELKHGHVQKQAQLQPQLHVQGPATEKLGESALRLFSSNDCRLSVPLRL
ncbi:MAG: hypothetical protein C0469_06080 [Cyanobacteria bacterium DS2.3.42]|nr:hypothetical protein [Cyanobacteria bacterium DS2.3.42]